MRSLVPLVEFVVVVWEDATKADDHSPDTAPAWTVGEILKIDENRVTIAGEGFADRDHRNRTTIPRRMVKRIIPLKPVKGRGRGVPFPEFVRES